MSLSHHVPRFCRSVPEKHIRRRQYRTPDVHDDSNHWILPRVSKPVTDDEEHDDEIAAGDDGTKKRKRNPTTEPRLAPDSRNCSICLHYNGMLYLNFIGQKEMVVVEQPWLDVVETFPDAIQRKIYGCN